ncbi:zinc finger CCCH domain-containing protein 19 isoform X1 [Arachis hypogaea]|uniref:zinc finger CCCH domain-containing protein 19 isoform X1 n=2 Tax=Arachis TaxID=3817 RepID=UPI000DECF136|nr:zinc finger CCCH domain-containing protein 19 isoform X2 [Arachis hypogaea]
MDAEDEEAQHLQHSYPLPYLSTTSPQCHSTGVEPVDAATTADNRETLVGEAEQAAVAANSGEAVEEAVEETEIGNLGNAGEGEMQVVEDKVVGPEVTKGDDVENGQGQQEEDEIMVEATGVAKMEKEEAPLVAEHEIRDGEDNVVEQTEVPNEAASVVEREQGQEKEDAEEEQEEEEEEEEVEKEAGGEQEADAASGMANEAALLEEDEQVLGQQHENAGADVVVGGVANEATFIKVNEGGQQQQHQEEQEDADVGGGLSNETAFMEEQEAAEKQGEDEEEEQAAASDDIGNEAALTVDQEEEQADAGGDMTNEAAFTDEHEEEEEEEEEEDGGGSVGRMGEETEPTEETEETEEQSRSVSGGKRKRGSGKNSKSTGRAPSRKKMEEDVCFICFDGGELVLCDRRGCPKAYHPSCVNRDEAFFRSKGKWNCGWHICSNCEKNAYYMCYTCTFSLCKGCIKDAVILCVRGNKGFCETCMRTVMLIEQNNHENMNHDMVFKDCFAENFEGQVDFDDRSSWEYLFKDYYLDLKEKLSLTFDELTQAKNPWKGSDRLPSKEESADELFDANNDRGSDSDSSYENVDLSRSKRRKGKKRTKSRSREGTSYASVDGASADESSEWASKELLEFVMHMRNGDRSILSQFDVQALLLEYIKRNKLRDPRRKSQIICDTRLQNLFGKPRVGHFEMLKLLESHFLLKEDSQTDDMQGSVLDTEISHLEGDGNSDSYVKAGKDKRRKTRKKGDERGLQTNVDDYAAIDNHNVNLIYLRRNLVEELLEDTEKFHDRVVGAFVRIRISGSGQKQDLYRLVQVVGTCKASEPYKVGKRMTDFLLEILNLNKTEIVSIDIISNQEFTEDECKRLRQSIKCGLINRLTLGDIQEKALALQAVRVNDWLETEIVRLSHLRDRASEKGRRKELRECVEKLQLLKTPEERQRRLEEIPEIHVDPKMDPSHESEEDEDEMDEKRQENYMRPRGPAAFGRRGREIISPRSGPISSDSWSATRNYSSVNRELSRNLSNKGFSSKGDDVSIANEVLNDAQLPQGRDWGSQSSGLERQKLSSSFESGTKSNQLLSTPDCFSAALSETSAVLSSVGAGPPAMKINESEKMWHYQDPSGKVQGPFSMVQLRKWSNTGYFPADLRIWKASDKQDQSMLLTDALAGKFPTEPSMLDKTPAKAQSVIDPHYSSSYSGKSHLAVQAMEGQAGGRPSFDHNSGSHNPLCSPGQNAGGSWRSKDTMNSLASRPSLAVEVPKNLANGWGSDAGLRNEATNLPSPTPQTASGGTKMQAFENKWSPTPTPVLLAGSLLGNSLPVGPESRSSSQPGMISASKSDNNQVHVHAALPAIASGVDIQTAGVHLQSQSVSNHTSRSEGHQGWGSGTVPKPEVQTWGGAQPQRIEPNNPVTMPAQPASHGHWVDTTSVQNSASYSNGNPNGAFSTPSFPGMTTPTPTPTPTPEPWRPPSSNSQSNIAAAAPSNVPYAGWGMPGNQNINWSGPLPANVNVNWMPGQGPGPSNATPVWGAPSQGPPAANAVGWVAPGQGRSHVNANAGLVAPGQGPTVGSTNPGWGSSSGNPGTWGGEQSRNGDRFHSQGDRGTHGGDSGYGGKSWNRQSSFNGSGRGGSSRPPVGGQRGVCKFHESGHCKKGASCDFMHT